MKIAMLPGDDIGPEISDATRHVLEVADEHFGLGLDFDVHEVGMASLHRNGTTLPESVVDACVAADGVLLGPGGMTLYPPVDEEVSTFRVPSASVWTCTRTFAPRDTGPVFR